MTGPGWCWLTLIDDGASAAGSAAAAAVEDSAGRDLGVLAAWPAGSRPVPHACRVDAAVVDPSGPAGWVSLVVVPEEVAPLFDDPAVSQAMRDVLSGPPRRAVSTLVRDAAHFAGAVTVVADGGRMPLVDDPFARIHPARLVHVGPGLFGRQPPPAGPVIQRYAGKPWPASGF